MSTGGSGGDKLGGIFVELEARTGSLYKAFDESEKRARQVDRALKELKAELKRGEISYATYRERASALAEAKKRIAAESANLRSRLDQETAAVQQASQATYRYAQSTGALKSGADGASRASRQFSQNLLVVGQTLDDLQYVAVMGLRPILNNIMQLSAGVGIVAVVAYNLYVHWDSLMNLMGMGKVKTEAEEMEALAQATERTADQTDRLNRYKARQQSIENMGGPSNAQKASTQAFEDVIRNTKGGREGVAEALVSARNPNGLIDRLTPEEQQELSRAYWEAMHTKGVTNPAVSSEVQAVIAKAREREMARARKDLGDMAQKPELRASIIRELSGSEKVDPFLREQIAATTPEAMAEAEQLKKDAEARKTALDEQERASVEHNQAIADREKEAAKLQEHRAGLVAGAMEERYLDAFVLNRGKDAGDTSKLSDESFRVRARREIIGDLLASGEAASEDDAKTLAAAVEKKLIDATNKTIATRALKEGVGFDQAALGINADLADEEAQQAEAEANKRQAAERKREAAEREADREAVKAAQAATPAMEDRARRASMNMRLRGMSKTEADKALRESLEATFKSGGLDTAQAKRAAGAVAEETTKRTEDDLMSRALALQDGIARMADERMARAPEFLGASEMVKRVQAGAFEQNPQLKAQMEAVSELQMIKQIMLQDGQERREDRGRPGRLGP